MRWEASPATEAPIPEARSRREGNGVADGLLFCAVMIVVSTSVYGEYRRAYTVSTSEYRRAYTVSTTEYLGGHTRFARP